MANPGKWLGMKYPDSDLVGLLFRHARPKTPGLLAIDVGCGAGRHLKLLEEMGYQAIGVELDSQAHQYATANGFTVYQAEAAQFVPPRPPTLAIGWGFMMMTHAGPAIIAAWRPEIVVADWRTRNNTCYSWQGNQPLEHGGVRLHNPSHLLHGQTYCFHDLDECHLPGYTRLACQTITKNNGGEVNEWYQTVHVRS